MSDYKQECFKRLEYTNKYSKYSEEDLIDELYEKDKEIERLNNIINELEKYLKENSKQSELFECDRYYKSILDKLKKLKEGKQ